jgi:hypothetical protein
MSLTLHQEILIGIMQRLTPPQQSSVVSFAKGLAKVIRTRSSENIKESRPQVKKTTPQVKKTTLKKNYRNNSENTVEVVDGRTPLATRLANEPAAPVIWIPVPPLSEKERTFTKSRRYYDDGTGVRVYQGGLCNRK